MRAALPRGAARLVLAAGLVSGCVSASRFQASQAEADGCKAKAWELEARLSSRESELAALKKDLAALKADLEAARAEKVATADALNRLEAGLRLQLQAVGSKLKAAEEQVASLKSSVRDLEQASQAGKNEMARKLAGLVAEKNQLAQKVAEGQAALADMKLSRDEELGEMRRRLTSALEEKVVLEREKAQAEAARLAAQREKEAELARFRQSYEDLAADLKAEIAAGELKLIQLQGKLGVRLVDKILFDSASAEIKPVGRRVLSRIGKLLNEVVERDIRIEGHTDDAPIPDGLHSIYASNWELSTARASAVARFLQDAAKIDPRRLTAAGYGEFRPVAPNDKPESRALNRRIEIVLIPKE